LGSLFSAARVAGRSPLPGNLSEQRNQKSRALIRLFEPVISCRCSGDPAKNYS